MAQPKEESMLRINKKTEYALMVLKYMSEKEKDSLVSVREICDRFNTPFDTTAKVMQVMNSNDLLDSVKGIKGGYVLKTPLEKISYMDLAKMIEGKKEQAFCETSKGKCELEECCNIASPLQNLSERLNSFLKELTLRDLFSNKIIEEEKIEVPNLAEKCEAITKLDDLNEH